MSKGWIDDLMRLMCVRGLIPTENIERAQRLKQSHFPQALYKFREVNNYSLSNLREATLHLTVASNFNDPYDSAVNYDPHFGLSHAELILDSIEGVTADIRAKILMAEDPVLEVVRYQADQTDAAGQVNSEVLAKIAKVISVGHESFIMKAKAEMNRMVQNTYKICSLTERLDSLPLWAHYAKNHCGFAMEYDFRSLQFDDLMGLSLWPVRYSGVFDASEMLKGVISGQPINNMFALVAALHKSPDWAYEEEWRLVMVDGSDQPPRNFRVPLKAVYLGSQTGEEHTKQVVRAAAAIGVPVYRMRLVPHEFRMEAVPHPL
jgi:DnaJ-domain-containing protein 1